MANKRNGLSYSDAGKLGAIASKQTHNNKRNDRIKQYLLAPNHCLHCGKILEYNKRDGKFCSSSCAASYNNRLRSPESRNHQKEALKKTNERKRKVEKITNKNRPIKEKPIKYCKYCGAVKGQCKDLFVCKHYQIYKTLEKFGFNKSVVGTEQVISEFYRIRSVIEDFYKANSSNNEKLIECFSYTSGSANFMKIIKSLNIESKEHGNAISNAWSLGRINPINTNGNYQYQCGWHTSWDGKEVYLRSSYELEYAQELDGKQIKYDVELLRIKYFDTKENIFRCAIPDFYLPDTNTIVEIKSTWTYDEQNMKDKFRAYKDLGYNTKLILDKKELIIN